MVLSDFDKEVLQALVEQFLECDYDFELKETDRDNHIQISYFESELIKIAIKNAIGV